MARGIQRNPKTTPHKGTIDLEGSFATNGASAPAAAGIYGNWISSVAHSATGVWTITLKEKFRSMQGMFAGHVTPQGASAAAYAGSLGAQDLSAGTCQVCNATAGALADIAAATGNRINVTLTMKYERVVDGGGLDP